MKQEIIEQLEHLVKSSTERFSSNMNEMAKDIKFLLAAQDIKEFAIEGSLFERSRLGEKPGSLVSVRPIAEQYEGKTFIGFLVGEMATGVSMKIEGDKMILKPSGGNPCIFIPELGITVMGYESWWGIIESEEDFRKITNEDIENTWYVKAWKQLQQKEQKVETPVQE